MRLFVVLALLAFTCSQANVLRSDEPEPRLELVKDRFWEYFVKATKSAHDSLQTFGKSEFGQELSTKFEEIEAVARQHTKTVMDQLYVIAKESREKVSEQVERLSEYLDQAINEVRAQLAPYTEEMRANIKPLVQKLRQLVDPYTESQDIKGLEDALHQWVRELSRIVEKCREDLESQLEPSTEELREKVTQRMNEIERSLEHLSYMFRDVIRFSIGVIYYMSDITRGASQKMLPHVEHVKSQLTALWES